MKKGYIQAVLLWTAIVVTDTWLFAGLHLSFFDPSFERRALAWFALFLSLFLLTYGIWIVLGKPESSHRTKEKVTASQLEKRLQQIPADLFSSQCKSAVMLLGRLEAKKPGLKKALDEAFAPGSITWNTYQEAIASASQAVLDNLNQALDWMEVFDRKELILMRPDQRNLTAGRADKDLTEAAELLELLDQIQVELKETFMSSDNEKEKRITEKLETLTRTAKHYREEKS